MLRKMDTTRLAKLKPRSLASGAAQIKAICCNSAASGYFGVLCDETALTQGTPNYAEVQRDLLVFEKSYEKAVAAFAMRPGAEGSEEVEIRGGLEEVSNYVFVLIAFDGAG